ncbi:hypothetical protein Gotri_022804 [Gossypium trilobum]|uniref:HAT C-terminal dimerisation domain-containing protein n=1 Tax=Gossypium trilobum TaxID=34281 RepID=A0A7J9DH06_9ROSI|nr:hypothetical protein [Gossypium trilobum]
MCEAPSFSNETLRCLSIKEQITICKAPGLMEKTLRCLSIKSNTATTVNKLFGVTPRRRKDSKHVVAHWDSKHGVVRRDSKHGVVYYDNKHGVVCRDSKHEVTLRKSADQHTSREFAKGNDKNGQGNVLNPKDFKSTSSSLVGSSNVSNNGLVDSNLHQSNSNKAYLGGDYDESDDYKRHLSESSINSEKSQLDLYLKEPKLKLNSKIDVLDYWSKNLIQYHKLSLLARNLLAIPILTIATELTFSMGKKSYHTFEEFT